MSGRDMAAEGRRIARDDVRALVKIAEAGDGLRPWPTDGMGRTLAVTDRGEGLPTDAAGRVSRTAADAYRAERARLLEAGGWEDGPVGLKRKGGGK